MPVWPPADTPSRRDVPVTSALTNVIVGYATSVLVESVRPGRAVCNGPHMAHPRRLSQGLHHPSQLRKSWYFFFFATPGLPEEVVHLREWHSFRHFLEDARPPFTDQEIERAHRSHHSRRV